MTSSPLSYSVQVRLFPCAPHSPELTSVALLVERIMELLERFSETVCICAAETLCSAKESSSSFDSASVCVVSSGASDSPCGSPDDGSGDSCASPSGITSFTSCSSACSGSFSSSAKAIVGKSDSSMHRASNVLMIFLVFILLPPLKKAHSSKEPCARKIHCSVCCHTVFDHSEKDAKRENVFLPRR